MRILPEKIYKGFDSSGNPITIEEWDYTTYQGWNLIGNLFIFVIGIFIGSIMSPVMFLLGIYGFDGRKYILHIIGALISTYFLIDYYNAWIAFDVVSIFCENSTMNFLVIINSMALAGHLAFFLFGWTIQSKYGNDMTELVRRVILLIAISCFIGYLGGLYATNKNKNWVEYNKHKDDPKNKYEGMTNQQIEDALNKEYEDQLRSEGRDPEQMKRYSNSND